VGAFVLGGLALGAAALLALGGRRPFASRRRIVVFFDESVSGLERGAAVKFRGVHSGRVVKIVPMLSPDAKATAVAVICDMAGSELEGPDGRPLDLTRQETLQALVTRGLRARLAPAGLSGDNNVDLDFFDPKRYPARKTPDWESQAQPYPEVPSVPSLTGQLLEDLQDVLGQLREADVAGVAQTFKGEDLRKTIKSIGAAAQSVKDLADYLERNPSSIISGKKAAKP
jgi:ABC-type transporter Mla subunit MlaD